MYLHGGKPFPLCSLVYFTFWVSSVSLMAPTLRELLHRAVCTSLSVGSSEGFALREQEEPKGLSVQRPGDRSGNGVIRFAASV